MFKKIRTASMMSLNELKEVLKEKEQRQFRKDIRYLLRQKREITYVEGKDILEGPSYKINARKIPLQLNPPPMPQVQPIKK